MGRAPFGLISDIIRLNVIIQWITTVIGLMQVKIPNI